RDRFLRDRQAATACRCRTSPAARRPTRPSPSGASRPRAWSPAPRRRRARRRPHGRRVSSRPGPASPARRSGAASGSSAGRSRLSGPRTWPRRLRYRSLRQEVRRRFSWGVSIIPPMKTLLTALALVSIVTSAAIAQDTPRSGGELIFVVAAEPPSFDAHQEETFAMLHPGAPQYNTLRRTAPADRTGTKIIGDLAESWTISPDRRTYTFKVRKGVKFHDGSVMTSKDVKASYDHIISPPAGVHSSRQATY